MADRAFRAGGFLICRATVVVLAAFRIVLALLAWLALPAAAQVPAALAGERGVLVLLSSGYGQAGIDNYVRGLYGVLREQGVDYRNIHVEYLDLVKTVDPEQRRRLGALMTEKYPATRVAAIVAVQPAAVAFLGAEGRGIAPGVPVLVAHARAPGLAGDREYHVQTAPLDFAGTLQRALELFPATRRVVLMSGSSPVEADRLADARRQFEHWRGRLDFEYLDGLTLAAIERRLAATPPDTVIIAPGVNRDGAGQVFAPVDTIVRIAASANAPVFPVYSLSIGRGPLGGMVSILDDEGRQMARSLLELLSREPGATAPFRIATARPVPLFDWRQIERWGGDWRRLPAESVFLNRPPDLWEDHHVELLGGGAAILVLSLLVIALALVNRRRALAERELRDSALRLRTVITGAPIVLHAFDNDGVMTLSEGAALAGMGLRAGQLVGRPLRDLNRIEPAVQAIARRALAGETFSARLRIGQRSYLAYHTPARGDDGRQAGVIGVLVDITEQVTAEVQLQRLNAELEQRVAARTGELAVANARLEETLATLGLARDELVRSERLAGLGALVAGVAHELGTPLGNSLTIATTLTDRLAVLAADLRGGVLRKSTLNALLADLDEAGSLLTRSLLRADELIRNFKQVAVDQTSEQRRDFDLGETVAEVVAMLRPQFRGGRQQIAVELAPGLRLDSYPGPLGQVVSNLVLNAQLHAFPDDRAGTIRIAAAALPGGRVGLSVADDGCGISAADLPRIFDPFFTTRLGQGGSGLGLHIVYGLVTRVLGGRIEVVSRPGEGSRFSVELPLRAPRPRAGAGGDALAVAA